MVVMADCYWAGVQLLCLLPPVLRPLHAVLLVCGNLAVLHGCGYL